MTEAGGPSGRSRLHLLYDDYGQSPWIDNLTRPMLSTGRLQELVDAGVRGVTSNPTIFAKAFSASSDYDDEFAAMVERQSVEDAYWQMVIEDVSRALDILDPVHRDSGGTDGFVSLEVSPVIAHDAAATVEAARSLHGRINRSNLMVKIPATAQGVAAIRTMVSEAADINVTLIFSLERYDQVIEAYLSGLEAVEGDLSGVQSVASFFVSRVDTLVDRRLEEIGTPEAMGLRGQVALAQARLAYDLFRRRFSGPRWDALRARGACLQRPLWASTSTKNPDYPDLLYVDGLIGPDTVDTLPDATLEAFLDHGQLGRTVDADVEGARRIFERLAEIGIDMEEIAAVLEDEGVAAFSKSFDELLQHLHQEAAKVAGAP